MRLLTRYILKEFLKPFVLALVAFSSLLLVSELFYQLEKWMDLKTPLLVAGEYLLWRTPEWIVQTCPVSILLATLFSLGRLARNNELTAVKASGISIYRILFPLVILSFFLFVASFLFNEIVVPYGNEKADYVYNVKIMKRKVRDYQNQDNLVIAGEEGRMYTIKRLLGQKKLMIDVTIDQFDKNSLLKKQIQAKSALWKGSHWVFYEGVIREFDYGEEKKIREENFKRKALYLPERLDYFCRKQKRPNEMNYLELRDYIIRLTSSGIPAIKEKVALYEKISFPFSCLIVMLIGIPFALQSSKAGKLTGFAISIFLSFLYWGMFSLGKAIGENRVLPPGLAVWLTNITFGTFAIIMTVKTHK